MLDGKLDFSRHPRHAMTADGGAAPYEHGADRLSVAAIEAAPAGAAARGAPQAAGGYEIVSEEELEVELGLREEEGDQT